MLKIFTILILLSTPSMAMDANEYKLKCKIEQAKATNECIAGSTKWSGNSNHLCIREMNALFNCEPNN